MTFTIERVSRYIARSDQELQPYEATHLTRLGYRLHRGIWITPERFTLVQRFDKVMVVPEPGKEREGEAGTV